jgi:hypothetical protein
MYFDRSWVERGFGCVGRNAISGNHRYLLPNQIARQSGPTIRRCSPAPTR